MKTPAFFITGLALALLTACSHSRPGETAAGAALRAVVITVAVTPLAQSVSVPGVVIGSEHAELASSAGGRVTRVYVSAGQQVTRGARLVDVDPAAGRAALAQAQAQDAAAHAAAEQAARDFQRYQALYTEHAVSPREFEEMQHRHATTAAAAQAADVMLAAARAALGYAELRAPFAGVVAAKNVRSGDFAASGAPLIVLDGGSPQVETRVSGEMLRQIKPGERAEVDIDGHHWSGTVIERVSAADPVTHTHLVKLALQKGAAVNSGAYASVRFVVGNHAALAVPDTAVIERAGLTGVFVVDDKNRAHFRMVRVGAARGGFSDILAGLSPGERVVVAPGAEMGNGTRVQPEPGHG